MKKTTFLSLLALGAALVGIAIAISAFFNRRRELLEEEYDGDDTTLYDNNVDYFSAMVDEETPEASEDTIDTAHPLEHGASDAGNQDYPHE